MRQNIEDHIDSDLLSNAQRHYEELFGVKNHMRTKS